MDRIGTRYLLDMESGDRDWRSIIIQRNQRAHQLHTDVASECADLLFEDASLSVYGHCTDLLDRKFQKEQAYGTAGNAMYPI